MTQVALDAPTVSDAVGVESLTNDAPAGGFPVGTTVVTWTALDAAGNLATAEQNVTVLYIFGAFLPPLEDGKVYKANRTLPVKFQLFFQDGTTVADAVIPIVVTPLGEGDSEEPPIDLSTDEDADIGAVFRYDESAGQYIYNLSTKGFAPGAYRIKAQLSNGQMPSIDIELK